MNSRERLLDILECREVSEDGTLEIGAIIDINPEDFAALRELDQLVEMMAEFISLTPPNLRVREQIELLDRAAQAGYGEK